MNIQNFVTVSTHSLHKLQVLDICSSISHMSNTILDNQKSNNGL